MDVSSLDSHKTDSHLDNRLKDKLFLLKEYFRGLEGACAIGFSGGVDSSFLMAAAKRWASVPVYPFLAVSCLLPPSALEQAQLISKQIGLCFLKIHWSPLAIEKIAENGAMRCYFCKKNMYIFIKKGFYQKARVEGPVLDGTQFDDLFSHRPGLRALKELDVQTPLAEAGFTKSEIRRCLKHWGYDFWDISAESCLATRLKAGTRLTKDKLKPFYFELETKKKAFY